MSWRRPVVAQVLVVLVAVLWAQDAEATSPCRRLCRCPTVILGTTPAIYFPIDYGLDLPTNGRILVGPPFAADAFSWVDDHGVAVAFDVVPLDTTGSVWLVPRAPLTPSTSYVLDNPGFAYERAFRTTSGADVTAPSLAPASPRPMTEQPCDALAMGVVAFDVTEVPTAPGVLGDYVLLDVTITPADGGPEVRYWTGEQTLSPTEVSIGAAISGRVCAGDSPGSTSTFPGAAVGDVVSVSITAIDAAGNASTPLVVTPLTLSAVAAGPSERVGACCGCRVGAPHASGTSVGVLLVLVVALARRARHAGERQSS